MLQLSKSFIDAYWEIAGVKAPPSPDWVALDEEIVKRGWTHFEYLHYHRICGTLMFAKRLLSDACMTEYAKERVSKIDEVTFVLDWSLNRMAEMSAEGWTNEQIFTAPEFLNKPLFLYMISKNMKDEGHAAQHLELAQLELRVYPFMKDVYSHRFLRRDIPC